MIIHFIVTSRYCFYMYGIEEWQWIVTSQLVSGREKKTINESCPVNQFMKRIGNHKP